MELIPAESAQPREMPLVQRYQSYRAFLDDWYKFKKEQRPGFSFRRFSALLGLKSPNYMQLVIKGERNLSPEMVERVCAQIGLKGAPKSYFRALVDLDSAKTAEERIRAEKAILAANGKILTTRIEKVRAQVVSEWYHLLVRELVFLPGFQPSGDYISRALNGLITPEQGEASFSLLREGGFVAREPDGTFKAVDVAVDTGDYVFTRAALEKHHGDTLVAWGRNLGRLSPKEQELGALHIPISSEKIPELRERIRKFQDEIIGWLVEERNPDRVVQLGTYLIPFDRPER